MLHLYHASLLLTSSCSLFFFFTDPATTEIYTLSLHDALPICRVHVTDSAVDRLLKRLRGGVERVLPAQNRSEEHTSELQSRGHLVCRLLLEKKKKKSKQINALPLN